MDCKLGPSLFDPPQQIAWVEIRPIRPEEGQVSTELPFNAHWWLYLSQGTFQAEKESRRHDFQEYNTLVLQNRLPLRTIALEFALCACCFRAPSSRAVCRSPSPLCCCNWPDRRSKIQNRTSLSPVNSISANWSSIREHLTPVKCLFLRHFNF